MSVEWWKTGVIYQIYPRSFQDSGNDGVGDLEGIRRRLPYVAELGADAIWLSPVFLSPMADFGYDIMDYCAIDPLFGTMEDFDNLLAEAHSLGLKVILDLVPNHTSDRHPWFEESRASRTSPKRDWYIWRDGNGGGPPNNWISNFGGSAWEFDPPSGQYYYHAFLKEQPDLNWRNPEVRKAMHNVLRFWLEKGVDGFRVDVIWHLMKDPDFRDNPVNPGYAEGQPDIARLLQLHSADHPDIHEVIEELRDVVDEFDQRVLIGEIYLPIDRLVAYYGRDLRGTHLPFNFQLLQTPWTAGDIAGVIAEYEAALPAGAWPNWVLGNHDKPRIAARVGEDQARVAAVLLLTLRGTPTLYYGDELGLGHIPVAGDQIRDPWELREPGCGFGRDPQRTPMQWAPERHAGFSSVPPWLPLSEDWPVRNVAVQAGDAGSMLTLHRALIALRRKRPVLQTGHYVPVFCDGDILAYERSDAEDRLVVILNLGQKEHALILPPDVAAGSLLISSEPVLPPGPVPRAIGPNTAWIIDVTEPFGLRATESHGIA